MRSRRTASRRLERFLEARRAPAPRPSPDAAAFHRLLPELRRRCPAGGWALLHRGALVGLYVSAEKARRATAGRCGEGYYLGRVEPAGG